MTSLARRKEMEDVDTSDENDGYESMGVSPRREGHE
jgi:hypothetical protein